MGGWREDGVEAHSEGVFHHCWDYSLKDWTVDLKTGIVVDLDQPRLELAVDHEIQPKYLKVVLIPAVVDNPAIGTHHIRC